MTTSISRRAIHQLSKELNKSRVLSELSPDQILRPTIQCRDRPFIAGQGSKNFPEYLSREINPYFKGIGFDQNALLEFRSIKDIGAHLRRYIDDNVDKSSAFLIKGLPFNELCDYQNFISGINYKPLVYDAGNAARSAVGDSLYTASDEPSEVTIEPHNEMAYLEKYPSKIMFYCVSAAQNGGDSPVVFNRDIKRDLSQHIYDKVKSRKIRYIRNLSHEKNSPYLTWQETFRTQSEEQAEKIMQREKMSWEWLRNGNLSIWSIADATINHPKTKEEIWFNQISAAHSSYYKTMPRNETNQHLKPDEFILNTSYGDGEEIEEDYLDEIRAVTWKNAMSLKLEKGDVLLLDNLLCLHSRMSYEGGERKLLVNLSW